MEDEEEIRSRASSSPDPSPSPPPGGVTVTVASTGPPSYSLTPPSSSSQQQRDPNALALALLPSGGGGGGGGGSSSNGRASGGGGGREDCWSEKATAVLIDAWGERYMELSRGNLKQKHWREVAEIVSGMEDYGKTAKTDIQCKNRIDTVKKKYKQEKVRISSGGGRSRWVFFDKLDRLIGSTAKIPAIGSPSSRSSPFGQQGRTLPQQQQVRTLPQQQQGMMMVKRCSESKRWRFSKRNATDSDSEESDAAPMSDDDSGDSLPPPPLSKRVKTEEKKMKQEGGNKWRELSRAIMRFGEAYEQTENAKLQQVVEMEKERMKFLKEMELQRMQFFVKTQLEISEIKEQGRRMGNTSNDHHKSKNNMNEIVNKDVGN
ncbi:hypothetical protein F2Q69_00003385 [Brassica cretica]|uniref:Myb/SANT-like DNA-binding domain-containing protein n=1 Tax=Brassica cretica TaxID=69181 RepID=A0A8S9PAV3_BRACR|nr:hypothetical protein F2Q69_00003385 [Brassica cretica]